MKRSRIPLVTVVATVIALMILAGGGPSVAVTSAPVGLVAAAANGNTTVFATSKKPTRKATVTVAKSGDGTGIVSGSGINCGSTCTATVPVGTSITLSAAPASGSTFGGWSGPCSGTGSCTFTVSANTSVTATFKKATTATLTVLKAGTGSGLVDNADRSINCGSTCTATVPIGTTINLREYSAAGSVFGGWSGACTGSSYCMFDVNADTTVTATFNKTPSATLTVVKAGDGTGTVTNYGLAMNCSGSTCTDIYTPPGSSVELNAAAAPGSVFAGWSGGPCTGTGPCRFQIFQNTTVTATFTKSDTPTVGLDVAVLYDQSGGGAGGAWITSSPAGITCGFDNDCSETYLVGTPVTLTIELASDTELAGWSGACTGTELTCTITMDGNKTATAQLRYTGINPD